MTTATLRTTDSPARDVHADAIVVDLALGEGPRGDQFVSYYRTRAQRATPVIVVSGMDRAHELARSLRAATLLAKPVEIDELLAAVRIFARPRFGRPASS